MKRIILHIGTPKTGTSALQLFLRNNRNVLSTYDMCYPKDRISEKSEITLGNGRQFVEYAKESNLANACKYLNKIRQQANGKTIILSSEGFYFHPKFMYDVFQDATIIVYFREQSEWIVSSYGQAVKGIHAYRKTFSNYLTSIIGNDNDKNNQSSNQLIDTWTNQFSHQLLDTWAKYFGDSNLIVRPYEIEQFKDRMIFSDFLNVIGISDCHNFIFPNKSINVSYSRDALEYKLLINNLIRNPRNRMHYSIRQALQGYSESLPDKKKISFMTQEQQGRVFEFFAEVNSYIARRYLKREDGRLFYNNKVIDGGLDIYEGLSSETIRKITNFIIEQEPGLLRYLAALVKEGSSSGSVESKEAASRLGEVLEVVASQVSHGSPGSKDYDHSPKMKVREDMMKITELITKVKEANPAIIGNKAQEKMAARLLRSAFGIIGEEIEATDTGVVGIAGLGQFRVRNVERENKEGKVETRRTVVFVKPKSKNKPE